VRVIVTGSRRWSDKAAVWDALNDVYQEFGPFVLVHGACSTGADAMAHEWFEVAARLVRVDEDPFKVTKATWEARGLKAGPERNERMVKAGAQLVLAFLEPCSKPHCIKPKPHDSHGTASCVDLARDAGIEIREIRHG
jgi:hypothetical protein